VKEQSTLLADSQHWATSDCWV